MTKFIPRSLHPNPLPAVLHYTICDWPLKSVATLLNTEEMWRVLVEFLLSRILTDLVLMEVMNLLSPSDFRFDSQSVARLVHMNHGVIFFGVLGTWTLKDVCIMWTSQRTKERYWRCWYGNIFQYRTRKPLINMVLRATRHSRGSSYTYHRCSFSSHSAQSPPQHFWAV